MARKKKDQDRPLHELLPPVTLKAMGAESEQQNQGNLLAAKQSPAFPVAGGLVSHALTKRGDRIMLDFTQNAVAVRFEVDGIWMNVDPCDRPTGDAILAVLKKIANLNVQDRRSRQEGRFGAVYHGTNYICTLTAQGVKTGERVLVKIMPKKSKFEVLEDLGMRPKVHEQLKELVDQTQGFVILATPPGGGLSTFWKVALTAADRYVRDFVAIEDQRKPEDEVINIGPIHYDSAEGQSPADVLPRLLLKQPDVFIVPDPVDGKTVGMLCNQVNEHSKMVITRVVAGDAIEALLRIAALKPPMQEFAQAVSLVVASRLVRKLCEHCRQPYQPTPQVLQKLGIPAGRVGVLYRDYQPPPPEQRVDAKGRPIEIEICQKCGGIGYLGRTGIFEMLTMTDAIREALLKQPTIDNLRRVARAGGHRGLQEEGIVLAAQGTTSLQELQRALK
jgi:type II secretory ATPase GspE/PulE/Tfp pilus assembly ATPase PilB-like protein